MLCHTTTTTMIISCRGQYVSISPKAAGLRKNPASSTTSTASHGPSASGAGGGRRRSALIRVLPPSFAPTHAPLPQTYKFDPSGDEPLSSGSPDTAAMPFSSGSQANRMLSSNEDTSEPEVRRGSTPYTIHIPPAQPIDSELERYRRALRALSHVLSPLAFS